MSWFRPSVFLSAACTSCGIVAYSTDDLSSGGTAPSTLVDAAAGIDGGTVVGDGGGSQDGTIGPGGDGSVLPVGDGGGDAGDGGKEIGCPANPCPGTDVCCYVKEGAQDGTWKCQPTCPGGATSCVGPQQCPSGNPLCCGTVTFGGGSVPNCDINAIASTCSASCTTNLGLSCNVTNTLRLCHQNADCASDPQNKNCCTYLGAGVSAIVCVSDLIRDVAGLSCLP